MTKRGMALAGIAAIVGMAACDPRNPATPSAEPVRVIGILEERGGLQPQSGVHPSPTIPPPAADGYIRPPQAIEVPDSVRKGEPFTARVTTVGDGCTTADGVEVTVAGNTAEVTAYDLVAGEICLMVARFLSREVTIRFDVEGVATVRLIGRRVENGHSHPDPVVVERAVVVF